MAKAYDRVEWSYLRAIMTKLGFAAEWIDRIMCCVESVSFSVKVNGFSSMLKYYGAGHLSRGVRVGIHCPWISHLLFADDCMVFTQATTDGANRLQEILERYRIGSGQMVNKQKSAIFFSANTNDGMKLAVHQGTDIPTEALVEKYLGLPTALGRSTDDQFEHIVATIKKLVAGEWNEEILETKMASVDVQAILKIPTGRLEEDSWAWHLERHGNFTVRSAYRALLQANVMVNPIMGSSGSEQSYWKKLWKFRVPPKEIKVVTGVKIPCFHPTTWAIDIIDSNKLEPKDASVILCGAWAVWSERNARKHGERLRTIFESVKWAADIAMDLSISGRAISKRTTKVIPMWQPPNEGVLKLNVDASFSEISGDGASGLVLRDHTGALIRGQAIWYSQAASVLIMESLAVRDGIKLASDLGLSRVEVETDSNDVVRLWNDRASGRSEISSILQEIEDLSSNMEYFHLSFIGREANEGAHLCAKQASSSRHRCLWINYVPTFLSDCLYKDCKPND
ncbi:uncharacterized protein [Lolium perenne]|uniref:uncharacterized protein n=1 Tax=Lolium perenne TaxID=4522 RepID=UPI003A9A0E01